ncbi:MAG: hypothetical protein PHS34_09445, partial [Candidatus Omnitrophica bacterium]|nr:hypothetical protein [Candidatus Omnitrophota bacterium]
MELLTKEAQQKAQETELLVKTYENYQITTSEQYVVSAEDFKKVKAKMKELDDLRKSLTKPLDESKKRIMDFFKKPLELLAQADVVINRAMTDWNDKQEKIRRAEEARLLELQRQEVEKLRIQAQKEAERISKLKTEEARNKAMAKQEELEAKAIEVMQITPVVESKVEKVSGIYERMDWKFEIVDANQIPREYMMPDEKMIGQMVKVTKG